MASHVDSPETEVLENSEVTMSPEIAKLLEASQLASELKNRIKTKEAQVGIIGLGYVGLPLARAFVSGGMTVKGFDLDKSKVQALTEGRSYIKQIDSGWIKKFSKEGKYDSFQ